MAIDLVKLDGTSSPEEVHKLLVAWDLEEIERYKSQIAYWEYKLLYYSGKQWLKKKDLHDVNSGYVDLSEKNPERYYPITNFTRFWADIKRSQIVGKNIRTKVSPNNPTNKKDIDSAGFGNLLLRAKEVMDDEENNDNKILLMAQIFGIGWRSDYKRVCGYIERPEYEQVTDEFFQCTNPECTAIDEAQDICPQCGADMEYRSEVTTKPKLDEAGNHVKKYIPKYTSEVDLLDPFRIKCSPASSVKKIEWIDELSLQNKSWIEENFSCQEEGYHPENIEKIKGTKELPRSLELSEEFKRAVTMNVSVKSGGDVGMSGLQGDLREDIRTPFHKTYLMPSKSHPKGRLIIWTPEVLIYDGKPDVVENSKLKRWHGYTPLVYSPRPLSFEGAGYIDDLIPINKKINSFDAMMMEYVDKTANPERIEFSNVQKNNDDASQGVLIVEPKPELPNGGAPTYLNHPQMSSEIIRMRQDMIAEGEKIGKVNDVVQGLRPAGVDTYRGLELLQDSANSAEAEVFNRYNAYKRESRSLKLSILQGCLKYRDPELIELMVGFAEDEGLGDLELAQFTGQDLRNNINVVIEEADYLSTTKAAQQDRVTGLLAGDILSGADLEDPIVKMQLLRKFGMGDMPMADKADIEKAERMIQLMEQGAFDQVQERALTYSHFDNRAIQVRVWSEWMKSSRFESLQPDIKTGSMKILTQVESILLQSATPPPEGAPGQQGGQPPPQGVSGPPGMSPPGIPG